MVRVCRSKVYGAECNLQYFSLQSFIYWLNVIQATVKIQPMLMSGIHGSQCAGPCLMGFCHSLDCREYLYTLLDARISLGTTTPFHRHLPQVHLSAMSLTNFN